MKKRMVWAAAMLLCFATAATARVNLNFNHYFDWNEVVSVLKQLNQEYQGMTQLRSLGKSEEGRDIWLLTIHNPKTGNEMDKPAVYVDGAIHGNEIQATEVCLYLAWYLLDKYDSIDMIRELVDTRVFYIVPTVNVDGRARFFEMASGYNIGRTAVVPFDDDNDGLADEDDYEDLDGDGEILQMRIRDPFGGWKTHPKDDRVMVRTQPGEMGEWRLLGLEGIDNDGDGRLNEDPVGYLDMNRNWGYQWQPYYVQGGAGEYPFSAKATRAISEFIVSRPNICFHWAFHNYGGLFVRGPGSKLSGMYPPGDVQVYNFLGEEGEKIIPGYRHVVGMEDMYTTYGDFGEWMYCSMGTFGFIGELFRNEELRYRKPGQDGERKAVMDLQSTQDYELQQFNDNVAHGTLFKPWTDFDHPQLGKIQIGGWRTFTTRMHPPFLIQEMAHRNAAMVIFTARHTPQVELELLDTKDLGQGLTRIRVRAVNSSALPTLSGRALRDRLVRQDIFSIEGKGLETVSGGVVQDALMDRVDYVKHRPHMIFTHVPSFGKRDVQWIVKGKGKLTIAFDSMKTSNRTLILEL